MAAEHYSQRVRAVERRQTVKLRVNVKARFTDEANQPGYNTLAEIPGSGSKAGEIDMLGAHLDAWHGRLIPDSNGCTDGPVLPARRHFREGIRDGAD